MTSRSRPGVWSRDELVRVDLEACRVLGPGLADGLEGCSPSQRLEVLGEVVGLDESQDVGPESVEVGVVEGLDGGLFDGSVHPLGLTIGSRMVGLGELVLDAMLAADVVEDMAHPKCRWSVAVLRQVGESHAIVGEHGVYGIGEGGHDFTEKGGAVLLGGGIQESDMGELRDPVDGKEHEELALGQAQLADVDVNIADCGLGEALAFGGCCLVAGQA